MPGQSARVVDINGWFEIKDQPLSKVGVYPYLGKNIPGAPDPDAMYMVYRSAEALSDPEFIESLKLTPWINDHTMLGPEDAGLTPAEEKGIGGVIGEQVYFDDETLTLYGNIKALSEAQKAIVNAGKKELSLGYRSKYIWQSGEYNGQPYVAVQMFLRGNHLASVDGGRMGPDVAVLDHLDNFVFTLDAMEFEEMPKDNATPTEGATSMSLDDALEAFNKLVPILAAFGITVTPAEKPVEGDVEPIDAELTPTAAAADAEPDDKDKEKDKGATTMDAADIARKVRKDIARSTTLGARLSEYVGTFDYSEKTEQEIAAYGVQKLKLTCTKGAEISTLSGYMQAVKPASAQAVAQHAATMDAADTGVPFWQKQLDARATA